MATPDASVTKESWVYERTIRRWLLLVSRLSNEDTYIDVVVDEVWVSEGRVQEYLKILRWIP
jgi:hypothetical protein